ncbi:MAG: 3',5'-cyclic-AMP phosphodiesterase [Gammaproteobacteria bacterium]|nr:3',5'-cyclic-AMP phosphodiesterase [Gammaproteobacteria bacterium]
MTEETAHSPRSGRTGHEALMVVQVTDTHLQEHTRATLLGVDTDRSLEQVLERLREAHGDADVVLATGDLTQDGSEAAYRRLRASLADLGAPVYCLTGNHDDAPTLNAVLSGGRVSCPRSARHGRWQLLLLNSSVRGQEGGWLAPGELDHLERALASYPDHHALVCLHHAPVPVGSAWMDAMTVSNAEAFFAVLDRHPQVQAILWGHIHQAFEAERRGVRLLASPSTCFQFKPGSPEFALDDAAPGYRWLRLHADGALETDVVRVAEAPATVDMAAKGY